MSQETSRKERWTPNESRGEEEEERRANLFALPFLSQIHLTPSTTS